MLHDLAFDVVELVPCPALDAPATPRLREVAFRADGWLPEEVDHLRRRFSHDADLAAIALELGRGLAGLRSKVCDLGLRRHSLRPWTGLEEQELARRYSHEPASSIAADLGRSPAAVYARAAALDLTEGNAPPYTAWEIAQIRAGYEGGVPVAQIAALIARPPSGIATIASDLGIAHANAPADWSATEQAAAVALADTGILYRMVAARLQADGYPPRSDHAVGAMLRKLGYGRGWGRAWTPEEDNFVRGAYETGASLTPLRTRLGRSRTSIAWRASELELNGTHRRPNGWRTEPAWTDEEIARLRQGYGKLPTAELATRLGRKKTAVYQKANSLGLVHGYIRPFSADEDEAIRIAAVRAISLTDLSQALERDPAVVSKRAHRIGVRFADRAIKALRGRRSERSRLMLSDILASDPTPGRDAPLQGSDQP